jgi:tetratricopeptide (TPR) repeat protein
LGVVRPPTEEVLASLAAVQAARAAARVRLRRDSRRIRLLTATFVAASVGGFLALVKHHRGARPAPRAPMAMVMTMPTPPSSRTPAAPAIDPALAAEAARARAAAAAESAARAAAALAACTDAYEGHRWRTAAETCAAAAEAAPTEAALAMKVAQAQHARGHYADAGEWAKRAIGLEGADPEAFVIVAHAERRAGNPAGARSAYRHYLSLAPRGWHASEARAALRRTRPEGRLRAAARPGADPAELG